MVLLIRRFQSIVMVVFLLVALRMLVIPSSLGSVALLLGRSVDVFVYVLTFLTKLLSLPLFRR